jgi:hypothetical protein
MLIGLGETRPNMDWNWKTVIATAHNRGPESPDGSFGIHKVKPWQNPSTVLLFKSCIIRYVPGRDHIKHTATH